MNGEDGKPEKPTLRRSDPDGTHSRAWKRTLDEMQELADARREDGWEATTVMAAHTDPVTPDMGDDEDYFGLVHVIPNNYADRVTETYDSETFTDYLAYGTVIDGSMYLVTELIAPDDDRSILVASSFGLLRYRALIQAAENEGVLYTHLKTIDGTIIGTFAHEEYGPLVPEPGS